MPIRRATSKRCSTCRFWGGDRQLFKDEAGILKIKTGDKSRGLCTGAGNFNQLLREEFRSCCCYAYLEGVGKK